MSSHSKSSIPSRKLKILMLHGYTQSGPLFQAKTQRLQKFLDKSLSSLPLNAHPPISGVELIFPTAPHRVSSADLGGVEVRDEAYGWWMIRNHPYGLCEGLDEGLARVAETLREHGPVDGIIGFSQGAAFAAMVASLLESGRPESFAGIQDGMAFPRLFEELQHPPIRFVISYSGLTVEHPRYAGFYEPRIRTPVLHVMGSMDTVVEESASLALAGRCEGGGEGLVVRHAGAHAVPTSERDVAVIVQFIRKTCSDEDASQKEAEEEDVLEMELPF